MSFVERGWGNAFIQENLITEYFYLTSTGVGDVATPSRRGARTIVYDPDTQRSGEFVPSMFIHGEPTEVTASLTRPLDTVNNYLQEILCPFNLRLNWACRGDRTIVWNYEVAQVLVEGEFEAGTTGQPTIAQPGENDRVATSGDMKSLMWTYLYLLNGAAQIITGDHSAFNDIAILPEECGDRCGELVRRGFIGYAVCGTKGYLLGDNVFVTHDGGASPWVPTAADPFLGAKAGMCVTTAETATGYRVIVGGGAEVGAFAEISYSDDEGASWTDVVVGDVPGQSINAICRDMLGRMWVAASGGDVYYSANLGMSWTLAHDHTHTAEDLNGICAIGENQIYVAGADNTFLYSNDGGTTWGTMTGPVGALVDLTSIDYNRGNYLFVTTDTGELWRTVNYGEDWVQVLDMGAGTINRVRFDERYRYFGGLVHNNAADVGTFMRTEDGGVTFMQWDTPANQGLNSLFMVTPNMVYVCGVDGSVYVRGFIGKFVRAPA